MATGKGPSPVTVDRKSGKFVQVSTGKVISDATAIKLVQEWQNSTTKSAIGVSNDYKVAPPLTPDQQAAQNAAYSYGYPQYTIGPQYFKGDESGGGVLGFPTDPDGIAQLQQHLQEIGYLKAGSYLPSQWNVASSAAYAQLLAEANHSGQDWMAQLNGDLSAASKEVALSQSHHTPLAIKLTDPAQIADTVNAVAHDLHGTYLTPEQLAAFTTQYQQNESAYQTQAYSATGYNPATGQQDVARGVDPGAAGPDTVGKPPDLSSAAQDAVRNDNPDKFKANTFTDRLNEILSGLQSPFGNNAGQVGPL